MHSGSRKGGAAAKRAPVTRRRRRRVEAEATTTEADTNVAAAGDAAIFDFDVREAGAELEGAIDDWASIDTKTDVIDDPAERRRRQ